MNLQICSEDTKGQRVQGTDAVSSSRGSLDVSIGNVPWEEHPNLSTSAWAGVEHDVTSVGGDESGHDGKAESGPCSGSTGFPSPEAVEGVGCAFRIHSRTGIVNRNHRATWRLVHPYCHGGCWRRVSERN